MEKDEVKKQIEEVNEFRKENFLEILLENMYPGFSDYLKAIRDTEHKGIATPMLDGTQDQIEETKQLIKESYDNLNEEMCCEEPKQEYLIDVSTLPNYLGNTHEEKINNYIKLKNSGIQLLGLPTEKDNSDFQSWIEIGKDLIYKELVSGNENLNNMYDTLAELNDNINDEEDRIEKLLNLLGTIND